tara:strand:- start:178 stop:1029 length:852 start_codon:yes stop_codon:yes gene_type:complete
MLEILLLIGAITIYFMDTKSRSTKVNQKTNRKSESRHEVTPTKFKQVVFNEYNSEKFIDNCRRHVSYLSSSFESGGRHNELIKNRFAPASEAQLELLEDLGYGYKGITLNMGQASNLISCGISVNGTREEYEPSYLSQCGLDGSKLKTQMDVLKAVYNLEQSVLGWFKYKYNRYENNDFSKNGYLTFWGINTKDLEKENHYKAVMNSIERASPKRKTAFKQYITQRDVISDEFKKITGKVQFREQWYVDAFAKPTLEVFPSPKEAVEILIKNRKLKTKTKVYS